MKKLVAGIIVILLLVPLVSCAASSPTPAPAPAPTPSPTPAPTMPESAPPRDSATPDSGAPGGAADRMTVRQGQMLLVVNDIPAAIDEISQAAGRYEGYVVSSRIWQDVGRLRGSISIRVSSDYFDTVMQYLAELAIDVKYRNTSGEDVTEEYVDLTAKLLNLEAAEKQLLLIMEKAEEIEDVLAVQRELTRVRQEIEQTKGRVQYLERVTATALIDIELESAMLEVTFQADSSVVRSGEDIRFFPQILGGFAPYSYTWDFGDGRTSTGERPVHEYRSAGIYTVSLRVTDDEGNTATETREDYIEVEPSWNPGDIAGSAWNALVVFARGVVAVLIWLVIFIPLWLVIGGGIYLVRRMRKKKRAGGS